MNRYHVGLKGHPVTVLVDEAKGDEFYRRPSAEVTENGVKKTRPRFDLTSYLCDFVEVIAPTEYDAQGVFKNAFGVVNSTAEFVIEDKGPAEGNRGVQ